MRAAEGLNDVEMPSAAGAGAGCRHARRPRSGTDMPHASQCMAGTALLRVSARRRCGCPAAPSAPATNRLLPRSGGGERSRLQAAAPVRKTKKFKMGQQEGTGLQLSSRPAEATPASLASTSLKARPRAQHPLCSAYPGGGGAHRDARASPPATPTTTSRIPQDQPTTAAAARQACTWGAARGAVCCHLHNYSPHPSGPAHSSHCGGHAHGARRGAAPAAVIVSIAGSPPAAATAAAAAVAVA